MASGDGVRHGGGRVAWGLGGSRRREGRRRDDCSVWLKIVLGRG